MSTTFAHLGVPERICSALARQGITEPFEIQAATIADAMAGRDVCGRAPTGSGKTLAFGIPLVAGVNRAEPRRPRALVLAPTRELAEQISTELRTFAGPVRIGIVYGGVGYGPQLKALRSGVDILVACPGRLEDLIEQGALSLSEVDMVVLDEADRMADMGFMPAVRRLLDQTADHRQTVLFSATLDGDVARLTRNYQSDPVHHEVGEETPDITAAHHVFWNVSQANRRDVTADAVSAAWPAIIFCRTRHGSDRLARQLGQSGIQTAAIHGGRSQAQRTRALADFSKGRVHALVATDVAARGIHVDGVASVIHFDPPEDHKAYVHRSGRTARAGRGGVVISLVQPGQVKDLRRMQRQIGIDEPFNDPDTAVLRRLSPVPARALAPTEPDSETGGRSGTTRRPHSGGPRRQHNRNGRSASTQQRSDEQKDRSRNRKGGRARSDGANGRSEDGRRRNSDNRRDGRKPGDAGNRSTGDGGSGHGGPNRKARRAHLQQKVGQPR